MPLPHLALFIQHQPLCCSSRVHLWPRLCTMIVHTDLHAVTTRLYYGDIPTRYLPTSLINLSSGSRLFPIAAVPPTVTVRESLDMDMKTKLRPNSHYDDSWGQVLGITCYEHENLVTCSMEELKETQRRKKIGMANKGKVPWNKGKKHSPETCARIKERTRAAMRDPKVRKRLSETSHLHSEQSKKKISSSLKQLWSKRLKLKRAKEKFYSSWVNRIAEAARRGGINEEELNWDSYEKIQIEIASRQLQWASEKANNKELRKLQAEKRAQKRLEKMALLAQKEHKLKVNPKARKRRTRSKKVGEELAPSQTLVKIHGKKLIDKQSSSQVGMMAYLQSALERFDIESLKREQMRSLVSLADQIQAAKSKRIQSLAGDSALVA